MFIKNLQKLARIWNLEFSAVGAILGIAGLATLSIVFPTTLIIIPAALCGWGIGVFHGIEGEINRNKRIKYIEEILESNGDSPA